MQVSTSFAALSALPAARCFPHSSPAGRPSCPFEGQRNCNGSMQASSSSHDATACSDGLQPCQSRSTHTRDACGLQMPATTKAFLDSCCPPEHLQRKDDAHNCNSSPVLPVRKLFLQALKLVPAEPGLPTATTPLECRRATCDMRGDTKSRV